MSVIEPPSTTPEVTEGYNLEEMNVWNFHTTRECKLKVEEELKELEEIKELNDSIVGQQLPDTNRTLIEAP